MYLVLKEKKCSDIYLSQSDGLNIREPQIKCEHCLPLHF